MRKRSGWPVLSLAAQGSLALLLSLFSPVVLPAHAAAGTTFYVGTATDQNDGGACTTSGNMDCSLREAIIAANTPANPADTDIIQVPAGTYLLTLGGSEEDQSATGDLDIRQNLQIDATGGTATVDASGLQTCVGNDPPTCQPARDRVLQVHGVVATLNDLVIQGGSGVDEGGGVSNNGGVLTLNDSEVAGNEAADGAGIYAGALASTTTLDKTKVDNNTASSEGGGIYNGSGDFLYVQNESEISANKALLPDEFGGNGGGIYNAGHAEVKGESVVGGSFLTGNLAERAGGGIYTTEETLPPVPTLIVDNSTISWNSAVNDGGGIYNSNDRVELKGAHILDNTAGFDSTTLGQPGGNGGGVYSSADGDGGASSPGLYVSAATDISGNTANECDQTDMSLGCDSVDAPPTGDGGGVYNAGHAEITDETVIGAPDPLLFNGANQAARTGGGIWTGPGFDGCPPEECTTLILSNAHVNGNAAGSDGGGIFAENDRVVIDASDILRNRAGTCFSGCGVGGNGGGIWSSNVGFDPQDLASPGLFVNDTHIGANQAVEDDDGTGGNGGGIYSIGHAEVTGDSVVGDDGTPPDPELGNLAMQEGGGIWTTSLSTFSLLVEDSQVSGNSASTDGGGIYNESDRVDIVGSKVLGNIAGAPLSCSGCVGYPGGNGGGVWTDGRPFGDESPAGLYVEDSEISANVAVDCRGFCGGKGRGGGIWNSGHADLSDDTMVDDNIAQGDGGGIWTSCTDGCGTLLLTDSTVNRNTSGGDGGGIWDDFDEARLLRTTVDRNRAGVLVTFEESCDGECILPSEDVVGGNGGGIWNGGLPQGSPVPEGAGPNLFVSHSAITRNDAPESPQPEEGGGGGGIWNAGGTEIENTTISGNTTDGLGGGFYAFGSESSFAGLLSSTIAFNHADAGGGGVAVGPDALLAHVALHNTIVAKNMQNGEGDTTVANDCFEDAPGEIVSQDYNLATDDSCNLMQVHDKPHTDPFLDLILQLNGGTTENHALLPESPAIDTGSPRVPVPPDGPACPENDQRGVSRPQGPACDRGAYERKVTTDGGAPPTADVTITKTASPETVEPGGHITYTLTVKNLGPDSANNVMVTDVLPESVSFVSVNTTKGSCSHASGNVTCELGSMAKDETVTITIEVIVETEAPGTVVNTASVRATNDPTPPNNSSSASTTVGAGSNVNCAGLVNDPRIEIIGTPADDLLIGTAADEVICGRGGDDTILGGGGNDAIYGEGDDDFLSGGPGDDTMVGGPGTDTGNYSGAPGPVDADLARGTATGEGASGRERGVEGGASSDTLDGLENLIGSPFPDRLAGDAGPNELVGKSGADLMLGRGANDILRGNRGNDYERGGKGDDLVKGGFDNDRLVGGKGDDRQTGGQQEDRVIGNTGDDNLRGGGADDLLNGKTGTDSCLGGQGHNTLKNCET